MNQQILHFQSVYLQNADVWDDSLLIKAYDESVKLQREQVAKRIATQTNKAEAESTDNETAVQSQESDEEYKVGDFVRATYEEDGIDYEAKIVSIEENGDFRLRFIGYENEQQVHSDDLLPTWGPKARKQQKSDAGRETNGTESQWQPVEDTQRLKEVCNGASYFDAAGMNPMIPPPPPMPPMLNDLTEDSEHLSSMLMAWYMSGYYTGLYQGQKMAQQKNQRQQQHPAKRNRQ